MVTATDLEYGPDGLPVGWPQDHNVQTIGYDVLEWGEKYLAQPDGAKAGLPWRWRESQARFVAWWYAVDEQGEFIFRRGQIVLTKGSGKSPFAAALACCEFGGPVVFSHFSEDGEAVGRPHPSPWVQLAAVSFDQTANVSRLVKRMLEEGNAAKVIPDLKPMDLTTRSRYGELQRIATSARSGEGARATAGFADEALALDTPIPTPSGWAMMGDLQAGDMVYGSDGSAVSVREAFPVQEDRECYRVTFDDGTSIVASDGHWWKVRRTSSRACPLVEMTTSQMAEDAGRVFYLPESFTTLETVEADLPIDPYLLGLWLGDGSSSDVVIACDARDQDELRAYAHDVGEPTTDRDANHFALSGGYRSSKRDSFKRRLIDLGVLGNKHIPVAYLRASHEQRLALLQGLMDSDGNVRRGGHARFANTNLDLLDGARELLISLGYHVKRPAFQVRSGERAHWRPLGQISFKATVSANPFRLKRKASQVASDKSVTRSRLRSIVKVERVETVPVRCIAVNADDRLFLAGVSMHPTRNTHHWVPSNGGTEFYAMMRRNLAKVDGRMLELTNCWRPGEESVAENTHRAATGLIELSGPALEESKRTLRWQPHRHVEDLRDVDALREAMEELYEDFPWVNVSNLLAEALSGMTASDVRRFYLNEVVSSDTALVLASDWEECQIPRDEWEPLSPGDVVTLGFDGGKTDDATALVACRVTDRTFHVLGIWEKPRDRGNHERVDWEVDRESVDRVVRDAIETFDVVGFYSDVALWETYVDAWSALVQRTVVVKASPKSAVGLDMRGNLRRLTEGTNRLVEGIEDHVVRHNGDERLRRHVLNAQRRPNNWGTSFGKISRESPDKVDALSAMLLADMARYDYTQSGSSRHRRGGKLIVLR